MPKKYLLKNGKIYWHRLYFDHVPAWMRKYSPPLGTYNYAAYLYQPHEYIADLYREAKWFVQRGYRGYSDRDVWSLDGYLCSWMPAALERLRRTTHGHPVGLTECVWDVKLRRMIRAFKTARDFGECKYKTAKEARIALSQFRNDFDVFKNYFLNLWD